jgi:formylglycine-generating enzyme required for sulfatase activity
MTRLVLVSVLLTTCALVTSEPARADTKGVRVEGKAPADYIAEQVGKSYAVVIGIDDYEHAPRLHYAVKDAKAMTRLLQKRGFQVVPLYNQQATKETIEGELGDQLVDRVGENDRVLIFYSGHGETKTAKGGRTQGYLLPVGGKQEELARTAISMGRIRELADALPSKHVLFLVDVCYGGIAGTQFKSLPKYTEEYLKAITRERGRQLIAAGGPEQQALEGPEWGHSVFTYYLLEGLEKGNADLNSDGIIPASELFAYLDSRVFAAAQMKGHTQKPELWALAAEKGEFVFFASTKGKAGALSGASGPGGGGATPEPQPSAALSQAEQELKVLEEQERQVAEQQRLTEIQAQIEEKKKKIEVARARPFEAPRQTGREIEGKDGAKMLLIPAGDFMMGSTKGEADEKPVHRVSLDAFYLDKYEVTNKLFQKFARETGYETAAEKEGKAWAYVQDDTWTEVSGANWRKPEGGETVFVSNREEHPVVSVSWYDAEAYCRWAGKRLPTEAEFEYANRGGTQATYWWGNGNPGSRRVANIADMTNKQRFPGRPWPIMEGYDDGYGRTAPVGSFEPNPFGLYDTTGNALEWTADWYGKEYYERSPSRNPTGPSSGEYRVLRGGSWSSRPPYVRSAFRGFNAPAGRDDVDGFRCAKTP